MRSMSCGESALARSLELSADGGADKLSQLLIEAVTRQVKGDHSAARSSLHQAWEIASEATAQVAVFMPFVESIFRRPMMRIFTSGW